MKRKHSKEFKEEAIKLCDTKTQAEVAKDLGIHANMLSKWKTQREKNPINAFTGKGTPEQEEIKQLKKQLSDAIQERDILKKAISIFSR